MTRKVVVQNYVSIDGFADDLDEKMSFVHEFLTAKDVRFQTEAKAFLDEVDTMILGAKTYRLFAGYRPEAAQEGEFGAKLNSLAKLVASTTLTTAPWGKWEPAEVTAHPATRIAELKRLPGKDLVVWGGPQPAASHGDRPHS